MTEQETTSVVAALRRAGHMLLHTGDVEEIRERCWALQWADPEELRRWQWTQLSAILAAAYEASSFYRRRLDQHGWPLRSLEAFSDMPTLSRRDAVMESRQIETGQRGRRFRRTSGGSTGAVVAVPIDPYTYGWYTAATWRGLRWWGVDPAAPTAVLLGRSHGSWLHGLALRSKDWISNWLRIPVDNQFDGEGLGHLRRLAVYKPSIVYGYPSAVDRLAWLIEQRTGTLLLSPRLIVLTGEPAYPFQLNRIQNAFQCKAVCEYGAGELGSMAFEAPCGSMHIAAESIYLESVAERGSAAAGLLIATHLHNRAFPLIRYETGDVGEIVAACGCGRGLPVLRLMGRVTDRLVGHNGPAAAQPVVDALVRALPPTAQGRVQVLHTRRGSLVLRIERGVLETASTGELVERAVHLLGQEWHVSVAVVDRLERLASGKLPFFIRAARA